MIRIKDPAKSIPFYRDVMGLTLIRESHHNEAKFSLYFFACLPTGVTAPNPKSEEAYDFFKTLWNPVLELTHNHGTESDPNFKYHNGNDEPKGYGHLGFLVDDVNAAFADMEKMGIQFKKKPSDGLMKFLAFAIDPDNYWVELVTRNAVIPTN